MNAHELSSGPVVVVIGAGFGGILAAINLKDKLGFHNFLVIEKAGKIGGTWRDNIYPGCRCDIVSYYYSLSTDMKHDWDERFPDQPSILAYMASIVRKHNLGPYIKLNTEVVEAEWIESSQAYSVTIRDNNKGFRSTLVANIIISATGVLSVPRMPNVPGIETFKGKIFHSSRWDASTDFVGKRVAVIGNGSSAAQIMAEIPKIDGIQVTQFFRTPNWFFPGLNSPISENWKWCMVNVPFVARLLRWFLFWMLYELSYILIFKYEKTREYVKKYATSLMLRKTPEKYHDILIPDFPVGSRRIVYDPGYLEALHLPNVDIRRAPVKEIYAEGVITSDDEKIPFDVIVCASGFVADKYFVPIRGRNRETVQEYYDRTEGPNAFLGINVPGFPNFFLLCGPNTVTGHTSVLYFEEAQMTYISQAIDPILNGTASSIEVSTEANGRYNRLIQERLTDSVFALNSSWYRFNFTGKNCSIFPGSGLWYWWLCRSVNWTHYKIKGLKEGKVVDLKMSNRSYTTPLLSVASVVGFLLAILVR